MTTGISGSLADAFLNVLRNTAPTLYGPTLYVQLHVGDPGVAGTANAAVGSTTRQSITLASPSGHAVSLTASPTPWTNGGTTETLTHVSLWSASTSGAFVTSFPLSPTQPWASGNQFTLTALALALAGIAA